MDNEKQSVGTEAGQLKAAFFAGFIFCLCFAGAILRSGDGNAFTQIDGKLNPNVATVSELAELPSIGSAKARAIADYRQGGKGFENSGDLEKVKGIGTKTAEKIKEWIKFEN